MDKLNDLIEKLICDENLVLSEKDRVKLLKEENSYYFWIGKAISLSGNDPGRLNFYRKALNVNRQDANIYYLIGSLYLEIEHEYLNAHHKALKYLRKAIDVKERHEQARLSLAIRLSAYRGSPAWGDSEFQEAEAHFMFLIKNFPHKVFYILELAICYLINRRYENSVKRSNDYIRLMPADGQGYRILGEAYHGLNKIEESINALERAKQLGDDKAKKVIDEIIALNEIPGKSSVIKTIIWNTQQLLRFYYYKISICIHHIFDKQFFNEGEDILLYHIRREDLFFIISYGDSTGKIKGKVYIDEKLLDRFLFNSKVDFDDYLLTKYNIIARKWKTGWPVRFI